jgi:hypothetical protein
MNYTSRKQGWAITGTAVFLALAVPVAVLTFFVLGLVAWVGHTIATVEVEAETPAPEASPTAPTTESARGTDGE